MEKTGKISRNEKYGFSFENAWSYQQGNYQPEAGNKCNVNSRVFCNGYKLL